MERLSYLETAQCVVALPALCSSLSIETKLAFFWPLSWAEWHFNLIALLKTNPNQTSQLFLLKASLFQRSVWKEGTACGTSREQCCRQCCDIKGVKGRGWNKATESYRFWILRKLLHSVFNAAAFSVLSKRNTRIFWQQLTLWLHQMLLKAQDQPGTFYCVYKELLKKAIMSKWTSNLRNIFMILWSLVVKPRDISFPVEIIHLRSVSYEVCSCNLQLQEQQLGLFLPKLLQVQINFNVHFNFGYLVKSDHSSKWPQ